MSLHCDLDLEDSKATLLHNTLAYDTASQYQVWRQMVQRFRSHPEKHSDSLKFCFDLDLEVSKSILLLLFLPEDTLAYDKIP